MNSHANNDLCHFTQVGSEEPVFDAVINWVKHDEGREKHLPDLLQFVRIPLLSAKFITDVVDNEVMTSKCKHFDVICPFYSWHW